MSKPQSKKQSKKRSLRTMRLSDAGEQSLRDRKKREVKRIRLTMESVLRCESPFCDVKIGVRDRNDDKVWIGANKQRLMEQSPFFIEVFSDCKHENIEELTLEGVSDVAMRAIVKVSFQQFDARSLDEDDLPECLFAASKFAVSFLLDSCECILSDWTRNLAGGLLKIVLLSDKLMRMGMEEYGGRILSDIRLFEQSDLLKRVLHSNEFLQLSIELASEILQSDLLNVKESEIFQRCQEWAESNAVSTNESNQGSTKTELLLQLKSTIRFPLMEYQEISRLIDMSELFTKDEVLDFHLWKSRVRSPESLTLVTPRNCDVLFKVGLRVCAKDMEENWYAAQIIDKKENWQVLVAFDGWGPKNDEWITLHNCVLCDCKGECVVPDHRFGGIGVVQSIPEHRITD